MTFQELNAEIDALSNLESVDTTEIGYSVLGRPIRAFHAGNYCGRQIIITGAIHAREWITALLLAELVKVYTKRKIKGGIYFVPLCNPDGVEVALGTGSVGYPLWKANVRGVDLNVNFDANWGGGASNVREAGSENFIGPYPNSEPEVQTLIDFTRKVKPRATIAYHSKGELVYYVHRCDRFIALKVAKITGYEAERPKNSTGGYSDWVSQHICIPALTIEVGNDDYAHPLGANKLPEILAQNIDVPEVLFSCLP